MTSDYWVIRDGAGRFEALHQAASLEELCSWARCPVPPELEQEVAP